MKSTISQELSNSSSSQQSRDSAAVKLSEELIEKYFNNDRLNDELLISQNLLVNPFKKLCSDLFEYFQPAFTIGLLDIDAGVSTRDGSDKKNELRHDRHAVSLEEMKNA